MHTLQYCGTILYVKGGGDDLRDGQSLCSPPSKYIHVYEYREVPLHMCKQAGKFNVVSDM